MWLGAGWERGFILTEGVWKDFMEGVAVNLVCPWDRPNFNPGMCIFREMNNIFKLLSSYHVSDAVLSVLRVLVHSIISLTP